MLKFSGMREMQLRLRRRKLERFSPITSVGIHLLGEERAAIAS
ncbi:hypothetical protein [Virgibacillus saliphilus]|nr:hypothetical protein [Virgibacillus sp. NKC19-3]